jgi:hypothetical protein
VLPSLEKWASDPYRGALSSISGKTGRDSDGVFLAAFVGVLGSRWYSAAVITRCTL